MANIKWKESSCKKFGAALTYHHVKTYMIVAFELSPVTVCYYYPKSQQVLFKTVGVSMMPLDNLFGLYEFLKTLN